MNETPLIKKIVSGGQTGADQAALDAAIGAGRPHGGWIPKGRKTESGTLPAKYQLREMDSADYRARTEQNVVDSDGTLILSHGSLTGGSLLTLKMAEKHDRPSFHGDCERRDEEELLEDIEKWLRLNCIEVLNVAGPRASGDPLIYEIVRRLVNRLLEMC